MSWRCDRSSLVCLIGIFWSGLNRVAVDEWRLMLVCVQMIAWASLALDVLRRNLRSFSLVSGEKEYNRDSD
jgi:hypothetical protein